MMLRSTLAPLALLLVSAVPAAHAELVLPRISPNATVTQTIGTTDFRVTYSRPGVKQRAIWGELVPWDKPWRTGANEATKFSTSDTITVGGKQLPTGTYSVFTIPSQQGWTVMFNRDSAANTLDYKAENDAARLSLGPITAETHEEWLRFSFENLTPTSCDLVLCWEKMKLSVPIAVDVNSQVLANARAEVKDWRTPFRAANWAFDSGVSLDEAAKWLDESLAIHKAYSNQALKARWLAKDGKKREAIAMAKLAVAAGKAATPAADTAPTEKLIAEWTITK